MTGGEVHAVAGLIDYQEGSVVSRKILGGRNGNVPLIAFAEGEGLTEHTSPYEALVVVLDGEAAIRIGGVEHAVREGETITLPASVPHALEAREPFKVMLVMSREQ